MPSRLMCAHARLTRRRPRSSTPSTSRSASPQASVPSPIDGTLSDRGSSTGERQGPQRHARAPPRKASEFWRMPLHAPHVPSTMRLAGALSHAVSGATIPHGQAGPVVGCPQAHQSCWPAAMNQGRSSTRLQTMCRSRSRARAFINMSS
jgi:hypothetical protein